MKPEFLLAKLDRMPMLKAVVPFAAGILAADRFALPLWFLAGAFLLSGVLALLLRSPLCTLAMLFTAGFGAAQLRDTGRTVPYGVYTAYELSVEGIPADRGRYASAEATVTAWRDPADGTWHPAGDRVTLHADTLTPLHPGERLRCRGTVRPLRGGAESYRRLMTRRGFAGTIWLSERTILERLPARSTALHLHAAERMGRLRIPGDAGAVCRAMTAGDRSGITPELRAAYSRSGLSHLLAVSGLHTGIVFALVNLLLWWLPLLRRGHLLRNLLAAACIWIYVAAAGFPPSAVRAAVMFTMLQSALASASEYNGLNALAAAAFGMLLWNPAWLEDISFQLSFAAVAAILAWGVPLCRRLRTRRRALNPITDALAVSLAATLATAPLVSHTFGIVPLAGVVVNPAAILLGSVVVLVGALWMLLPVGWAAPAFECVLSHTAEGLNALARVTADLSCAAAEYALGGGATTAVYLFFALATAAAWSAEPKKKRTFARMMTPEEYELLLTDEVQRAIAVSRGRDPLDVALDRTVPHARLVATQVKYLARAASKLPSYAAAQCILPPLAFEQASSEACAAHKRIDGDTALDLTCGLGVDALFLSRRFRRVVTLERSETLARIAAENFRRLQAANIEVVHTSAEEYLQRPGLRFDWIFADPDRRSADGRKLVRLEACSPDVTALMPLIARASGRLCIKNSPLFDVDEALRLFPDSRVEVVSLGDECKEVLVYADGTGPALTATALGRGSFTATPGQTPPPAPDTFDPSRYRWLVVPDVALQKARLARLHLRGKADIWSENGYGFAAEEPQEVIGKVFAVERIEPYDPRRLKRSLKGAGAELMKRDFPFGAEELARRLGVHAGADVRLAFTKIGNGFWAVRLK